MILALCIVAYLIAGILLVRFDEAPNDDNIVAGMKVLTLPLCFPLVLALWLTTTPIKLLGWLAKPKKK